MCAAGLAGYCWSEQTIFQNIPPGPFFTTVKLAVSLNLIMMYPVTMLPASKALEGAFGLEGRVPSAICRTTIVAAMSVFGLAIPSFEFMQSLTGSLTMFTALSMPPVSHS
jgi:proton-coupled amino acid transporter